MYEKIKYALFTLVYASLLARFFFLIGDPSVASLPVANGAALPFYTSWRTFIDQLYLGTGYLTWPLDMGLAWGEQYLPWLHNNWFPITEMSSVIGALTPQTRVGQPLAFAAGVLPALGGLQGIVEWTTPLSIALIAGFSYLLDQLYNLLRNLVWNVLIEFSFTKKKQAVYQSELEKRANDFLKLNVEYRNLSREASKLKDTVITDELTQLFNKRFYIERIKDEFEKARQLQAVLVLIMVDIDHFKRLNDTYGHLMGDQVLKEVARVVKDCTPKGCYACRFGGEEFSIILPGQRQDVAMHVAENIKNQVPQLRFKGQPDLTVTLSQGICYADFRKPASQELATFEDIIARADNELYKAKLNGRNRIELNVLGQAPTPDDAN
jgi:diguanylate cyclase (GGDEF)-like protein